MKAQAANIPGFRPAQVPVIYQDATPAREAYDVVTLLGEVERANPAMRDNHAWTQIRLLAVNLFANAHEVQ